MTMSNSNIVQAEFFFSRYRNKIVVRFFDEGGKLTKLTRKSERYQKWHDWLLCKFPSATRLLRWFLSIMSQHLVGKILAIQEHAHALAVAQVLETIKTHRPFAVEEGNSFYLIQRNSARELGELDALKQSIANSTHVWLFVFQSSNNLVAESNLLIALLL